MTTKEKKITKHHVIGFFCSLLTIIIFCEITINSNKISLSPQNQFLTIASSYVFFILLLIGSDRKNHAPSNIETRNHALITFLIVIPLFFSCLNSTFQDESIKRILILTIPSILIFIITIKIKEKTQFLNGIALGIITITTISILFGVIGLIADQNYITRSPEETILYKIGSIELSQKIAHRLFIINHTDFYIQRYAGIMPNPNGLGLISSISYGLSYNKTYNTKIRRIIAITSIIGIALSFSRMGLLLFVSIIIYMKWKSLPLRRYICGTIILALISFLIIVAVLNQPLAAISEIPIFQNLEAFQLGERAGFLRAAWSGFTENWMFGVGYGVGAEYLFGNNAETQAVHSVLLNTLLETGLVGTSLLVVLWLVPVFSNNESRHAHNSSDNHSQMIAAILFGLFIAEAFDLSVTRFHYIHLIFMFLLGIWSSLRQEPKDTIAQNVQNSETQGLPENTLESSSRTTF